MKTTLPQPENWQVDLDSVSLVQSESSKIVEGLSTQELRLLVEEKAARGNYQGAIALLDRIIAAEPDNAIDLNNRGLMHFRMGNLIEAIVDLDTAIAINPQLDRAYNNRANCYAALGDLATALEDYEVALDLNPANIRAWINQAITFRQLGLYDIAIDNFEVCLLIGKDFQARIYAERGRTYHLRGDWNCAVGDYNRAIELLQKQGSQPQYLQKIQTWLDQLVNFDLS